MIAYPFPPPKHFAALRACLTQAGYTENAVCERLQISGLHELLKGKKIEAPAEPQDTLGLLIRFFLLGVCVSRDELQARLPAEVLTALAELGLLARAAPAPSECFCPIRLYPCAGLFLASDRWSNPDGSPVAAAEDIVYPAITANTRMFLQTLPSTPCNHLLDLCCGTGVAALRAAAIGGVAAAWASDLTERSVRYAEFNRLLNGLENVTVVRGDVYEAVAEERFDRIVAHPPYVPALEAKWLYRDAGEEGEAVTRRIIEGLPRHLLPGGRLYCLAVAAERAGVPAEMRFRRWLGEAASEFDVLFVEMDSHTPEQVASYPLLAGKRSFREFLKLKTLFEEHGIRQFVHGLAVIQRARSSRNVFTLRRTKRPHPTSAEVEWLMDFETRVAEAGGPGYLLDARPVVSANCRLRVGHRFENGDFTPSEFTLLTEQPFEMECEVRPWTAVMIGNCDGKMTGRALYNLCRRRNMIHKSVSAADFAGLLHVLVSGGFLDVAAPSAPSAAE